MAIIELFTESPHKHAVKVANARLEDFRKNPNTVLMLDTNIIVELADHNEAALLNELASCPGFKITNINIRELNALKRHRRAESLIDSFLAAVRPRYVEVDTAEIEEMLNPLIDLIPRKLVRDVMLSGKKPPYLNTLIARYTESIEELAKIRKHFFGRGRDVKIANLIRKTAYEREHLPDLQQENVKKEVMDRFKELCGKLDVDTNLIDMEEYEQAVSKHINEVAREMDDILKRLEHPTLLMITDGLTAFAQKSYANDVKYCAEVIKLAASSDSADPDVNILLELHYARCHDTGKAA